MGAEKRASENNERPWKKKSYFFQPRDSLTSKPVLHSDRPVATDLAMVSKVPTTSANHLEGLIPDTTNSDDSFDGVRWKASPCKLPRNGPVIIPSSPLGRQVSPSRRLAPTNEHASNLLSKYGALPATGSSPSSPKVPALVRSVSDKSMLRSSSQDILHHSPLLARSSTDLHPLWRLANPQSGDFSHKRVKLSSALNTWMSKFDFSLVTVSNDVSYKPSSESDQSKNVAAESKADSPGHSPNTTRHHHLLSSPNANLNNDITFGDFSLLLPGPIPELDSGSDPFSDDDILIKASQQALCPNTRDNIASRSSSITGGKAQTVAENPNPPTQNSSVPHEVYNTIPNLAAQSQLSATKSHSTEPGDLSNSSDPFSDDDSELLRLLDDKQELGASMIGDFASKRLSPKHPARLSTHGLSNPPGEPPESNSQSATQNARDSKHAQSFRESSLGDSMPYRSARDPPDVALSFSRPFLRRFQIKGVRHANYGANAKHDQLIIAVSDANKANSVVLVRGEYTELDFAVGDIIHVIITDQTNPNLVDDSHNILIWNPDTLVSSTVVSQQLSCPRKTVLTRSYRFPGVSTIPIVVGEIIHLIFQTCLSQEQCSMAFMLEIMEKCISSFVPTIFTIGPEVGTVKSLVEAQLPYLETWFKSFFRRYLTKANSIPTSSHLKSVMFLVNKVLDVEEDIWSPIYGLRGKVDATVEAKLLSPSERGTYLLPMEIKTGLEYVAHAAQASLYALLFKDRYDSHVSSFLLVYTKAGETRKCDISMHDLKSLVNLRNRITKFMKAGTRELPPLLQSSTCDRCDVKLACMVVNRLSENGTFEDSGIPREMYDPLTNHLDNAPQYGDFFNYWDDLLVKEELIMKKSFKYLWTLTSSQREAHDAACLGRLDLASSNDVEALQQLFVYVFTRSPTLMSNFLELQVYFHDRVVISDENGNLALAYGVVTSLTSDSVTVTTKKRLSTTTKLDQWTETHQVYSSAMEPGHAAPAGTQYRVDKDTMYHGLALARYNILNLFLAEGDSKRRSLLADKEAPTFDIIPSIFPHKDLNEDQIRAINRVLASDDYSLIQGMPGTGKTTVIAELIKILVARGKSVLLTSYTHSAVDNILLKVKQYDIPILRLGQASRVHKDIHQYVPELREFDDYESFTKMYIDPPVVACTCLGVTDYAFNFRDQFDYCIIDEASQVSMPISLGPLRFCDKFVLVGDHLQLPPLVQHPDPTVKRGLSRSLFQILAEMHPQAVTELTYQYRMCRDIMKLSNVLVYGNRLKCGSTIVANQKLAVPHPENLARHTKPDVKESWLHDVLDPDQRVLFLNTDAVPAAERRIGEKTENPVEADLTRHMVEALVACGVSESQIGVMTFNKAQLHLLDRSLAGRRDVEVLTADRYQGRDKDCIIISLVRSNEGKNAGELVREWRRVNVAITRSRTKLIVLGSVLTLSSAPAIKSFIDIVRERDWLRQLPVAAHLHHSFTLPSEVMRVNNIKKSGNRELELVLKHAIIKDIISEAK